MVISYDVMFDLFRHNTMIKSGHQHRQDLTELTLLQIENSKIPWLTILKCTLHTLDCSHPTARQRVRPCSSFVTWFPLTTSIPTFPTLW